MNDPMTPNATDAVPAQAASQAEPAPPDDTAGYTICIDCKPDGTYAVHKEPLETPEAETSEGAPAETAPTPGSPSETAPVTVDSFEEALKAAVRIQQANPMDQSYNSQMSAGFQSQNMKPY